MHLLKTRPTLIAEQRANPRNSSESDQLNDRRTSLKPTYGCPPHLLVGHADAGLGEGPWPENLQALEQRGEVDPEFGPLRAVVLLEQAALENTLGLRVLCSSRHNERHGIARHLGIGGMHGLNE